MLRSLFLITLFFCASFTQELYYEGTGTAKDVKVAQEFAMGDLLKNIKKSLSKSFNNIESDEKFSFHKDHIKNMIDQYSNLLLNSVVYIEKSTGDIWNVNARVLKNEFERIILNIKIEIRSLIEEAIQAENQYDIATSLKNLYWAYLLSNSISDTISVNFPNNGITGNVSYILIQKIEEIIDAIEIKIQNSFIEDGELIVRLNIIYRDEPVQNLRMSYFDDKFQDWVEVHDGYCYLTQGGNFDSQEVAVNILVEYEFKEEMEQNSNIFLVSRGMKTSNINNNISINLELLDNAHYKFKTQKIDANIIKEGIVNSESVLSKSDIEIKTSKKEIDESPPILKELMKLRNLPELRKFLGESLRKDMLIYGNSDDFEDKEGLYIVVLDIDTNSILGVMQYKSSVFVNLNDNGTSNSLTDTYSGHKIAVIWIELFR